MPETLKMSSSSKFATCNVHSSDESLIINRSRVRHKISILLLFLNSRVQELKNKTRAVRVRGTATRHDVIAGFDDVTRLTTESRLCRRGIPVTGAARLENNEASAKLTTAYGGTFTSSSARLISQSCCSTSTLDQ